MIVSIYEQNALTYESLGLGAMVFSSCLVKEELNGAYELEGVHPYDDGGKWKRLAPGRIVCASTPKGRQPFRIYNVSPDMNEIKINARHIFYDLLDNLCGNISFTGTAQNALDQLTGSMVLAMPFIFVTDLGTTAEYTVGRVNPVLALLEDETGFVSAFGGELERDGHNVAIRSAIGDDRGFVVRYEKNLTGLAVNEDESEVKTRIVVYGAGGASVTVDSPRINVYPYPKIYAIEDESLEGSAMTEAAQELLDQGIDLPQTNIKAEFVLLRDTEEYADYAVLEQLYLGDLVRVINEKMNFQKYAKVISYAWNALLDRYENIELGDFKPSLAASVTDGKIGYAEAAGASKIARNAAATANKTAESLSGKITVTTEYLYVSVDGTHYSTSEKIFRFGSGGLEYTSDGAQGVWKTVIDADGNVV